MNDSSKNSRCPVSGEILCSTTVPVYCCSLMVPPGRTELASYLHTIFFSFVDFNSLCPYTVITMDKTAVLSSVDSHRELSNLKLLLGIPDIILLFNSVQLCTYFWMWALELCPFTKWVCKKQLWVVVLPLNCLFTRYPCSYSHSLMCFLAHTQPLQLIYFGLTIIIVTNKISFTFCFWVCIFFKQSYNCWLLYSGENFFLLFLCIFIYLCPYI